jgi:hypothetical protein
VLKGQESVKRVLLSNGFNPSVIKDVDREEDLENWLKDDEINAIANDMLHMDYFINRTDFKSKIENKDYIILPPPGPNTDRNRELVEYAFAFQDSIKGRFIKDALIDTRLEQSHYQRLKSNLDEVRVRINGLAQTPKQATPSWQLLSDPVFQFLRKVVHSILFRICYVVLCSLVVILLFPRKYSKRAAKFISEVLRDI